MTKSATALAPETTTPAKAPIRHPSDLMRSLSQEMDRLFDDFGLARRWPLLARAFAPEDAVWSPNVEIEEREGTLSYGPTCPD